jgi:methionine-rich copper-binding protein CopC
MASRKARGVVTALAVAALAAALLAPAASAHDSIVATNPSGSAKTTQKRVAVLFSGPIQSGTLKVFGPAGNKVSKGTGGRDPRNVKRLVAGLKTGLAAGKYTARVSWTAADGHRQEASFGFRLVR